MKCEFCNQRYKYKKDMIQHLNARHQKYLPEGMSAAKFLFSVNHGGRTTGSCRICSNETQFDEKTGRTKVFCENPKCKEAFAMIAQKRNINKFGVPHLLNDQNHQMFMLSKRKISGEYEWSDGKTKIPYVGSYERRFLEFMDNFMGYDPSTIHSPCPINVEYYYKGEKHTYTPDFYIDILDLMIEIKHGGDNPNMHHKIQAVDVAKDKAKALAIKENTNHNYIKIVDNKFGPLVRALFKLVEDNRYEVNQRLFILNESDQSITESAPQGLAAVSPISTTAGTVVTMYPEKDDDLVVALFTDNVNDYRIGISLESSKDNPIVYENDKFSLFNHTSLAESGTLVGLYKYAGDYGFRKDLNKLHESIGKSGNYISDVEAITSIMESVFHQPLYNVLQILENPNFVKIT